MNNNSNNNNQPNSQQYIGGVRIVPPADNVNNNDPTFNSSNVVNPVQNTIVMPTVPSVSTDTATVQSSNNIVNGQQVPVDNTNQGNGIVIPMVNNNVNGVPNNMVVPPVNTLPNNIPVSTVNNTNTVPNNIPVVNNASTNTTVPEQLPTNTTVPTTENNTGTENATVNETNNSDNKEDTSVTNDGTDNKKAKKEKKKKTKKKVSKLVIFLLVVILLMGLGIFYLVYSNKQNMIRMQIACTPVSTTKDSKELDLHSTIVVDLYSKVETNIREDLALSNLTDLNDSYKRYLAFRQIPADKYYDSMCNMFNESGMEPFTCAKNQGFTPKAFKENVLQLELKKLFGETNNTPNGNIQLGTSCIGGYQYIASRGEYVQGVCKGINTTMFNARKELVSATSNKSTITLKEKVKYYGTEGMNVPEYLISGVYTYTFKLDTNYNYVLISKTLDV